MRRSATDHALARAKRRAGVTLTDEQWAELADSLRRGEHPSRGRVAGDCERFLVQLLREDGSIVRIRVLYCARTHTIVTVLPHKPSRRHRHDNYER